MNEASTRRGFLRASTAGTVLCLAGTPGVAATAAEPGPDSKVGKLWEYDTGTRIPSSPAVADGVVYATNYDGEVHLVDAENGEREEVKSFGAPIESAPVVVDDTLYVLSRDVTLRAIDLASSAVTWEFAPEGEFTRSDSTPTIAGDSVVFADESHDVYCVDAADGDLKWRFHGDSLTDSVTTPTVSDGTVFVGTGRKVYAIELATGSPLWSTKFDFRVTKPGVNDERVFVGSEDHTVYALDRESGVVQWRLETGYWVKASPVVRGDTVYVGSLDGNLYALGAENGPVRWSKNLGSEIWPSVTFGEDLMYVGDSAGDVYGIDPEDGSRAWKTTIGERIEASPTIVDGRAYVTSSQGMVYALADGERSSSGLDPVTIGSLVGGAGVTVGVGYGMLKRRSSDS